MSKPSRARVRGNTSRALSGDQKIGSQPLPRSWSDLERFAGTVAAKDPNLSGPAFQWLAGYFQSEGEEKGKAELQKILTNKALSGIPSGGAVNKSLIAGDAAVAIQQDTSIYELIDQKEPITVVYPTDGVVAPMFYGAFFGAPGALAYKAVNTLDSMVGYRQPPYEDLGWASARLDDLANLAPSRLTMLSTAAISGRPLSTLLTALRYGPLTTSPNAGMAEAAFAGALGVRLGGANTYGGVLLEGPILGDGRLPVPEDIRRAVGLMRRCCVFACLLVFLAERVFRG